jgi:SAM-dependent methyltransferase
MTPTPSLETSRILSHQASTPEIEDTIAALKTKIQRSGDKLHATVEKQLHIVDELAAFPLGRFILQNRGTDGYWTDYMIEHQHRGRFSGVDPSGRPLTSYESFFLDKYPLVVATQQRAVHFTEIIQKEVKEGAVLASLPCGLMRDLLRLDFSGVENFRLVGLDIDPNSLRFANDLADEYRLSSHVEFSQADAWNLPFDNCFTLLTSNGLNVYEPSDEKVVELYRQCWRSLVSGGVFVTSFISPSPAIDPDSEWRLDRLDPEGILHEKILYADILQFNLKGLRNSTTTRSQLEAAGFVDMQMVWDDARVFPTVIARKP